MSHSITVKNPVARLAAALAVLPALAMAGPAFAHQPAAEAFGFLVGSWEGTGEASAPEGGPRGAFTVQETIAAEAGGHAVSLRGTGEAEMQPGQPPVRIHDAFALVWRHHDGTYRIRSVTMHGQAIEAEISPTPDGFEWGFAAGPMGEFRYSASVDGDSWTQSGYYRAPEGGEWSQFMTMSLSRVSD